MFGLPNVRGSCWVNSALQGIFACPSFKEHEVDQTNPLDVCLTALYKSNGKEHLKDFMECVKTTYMPAGENIGDSHELLVHLCDKLPFLDEAFRFKVANQITCKTCNTKSLKEDTVIELNVTPLNKDTPILNALQEYIAPVEIEGYDCETCKSKQTCVSQQLFGTFPKILMIHRTSIGNSLNYSSVLVLNGNKYALGVVVCFNGGHWWAYARGMPPGKSWFELDDTTVREMTPTQFPVAGTMRILLYFLLEN